MKVNKEVAELMGIMLGDGCLSRSCNSYTVYIYGHKYDDFQYHNNITKKLFLKLFNKKVSIGFKKNENTLYIRFRDKEIFNTLNFLGVPIGNKYSRLKIPEILVKKDELLPLFIRGLIDTDGCVIFSKQHRSIPYYPRIELTSKSYNFLKEILNFLVKKRFYGSISDKGRAYRLEISGFKNLDNWINTIGFNNPKHFKKIGALYGPQNASAQT